MCVAFRCSTLLVVGDNSPTVDPVVDCNSKLNPTKTTFLKVINLSLCVLYIFVFPHL